VRQRPVLPVSDHLLDDHVLAGTFPRVHLRSLRQLDAVAAVLLARLAARTPLLPGTDAITLVDVDDTVRQTYGYAKQGAGYGYNRVKGLSALLAEVDGGARPMSSRPDLFYRWPAEAHVPKLTRLAATIETWWPPVEAVLRLRITNARTEGYTRLHRADQARRLRVPQA
jgi:hypothetical protein